MPSSIKYRIYHNYPLERLQREAMQLERVFCNVPLTVQQARTNRRVYSELSEELQLRGAQ